MEFLNGIKSYLLAGVTILLGVVELIGIDVVPSITQGNAIETIMVGFGIFTTRSALKKIEPPQ